MNGVSVNQEILRLMVDGRREGSWKNPVANRGYNLPVESVMIILFLKPIN